MSAAIFILAATITPLAVAEEADTLVTVPSEQLTKIQQELEAEPNDQPGDSAADS